MALKATNLALVLAYNAIKSAGFGVRSLCVSSKATLQAGSVKATQLFDIVESLVSHKTVLQSVVNTAGLLAYAKAQEDDAAYDVVAEVTNVISKIDSTVAWFVANFPADGNGYLLTVKMNADGTLNQRTFTTVQTAGLVTQLDTIIAAVS